MTSLSLTSLKIFGIPQNTCAVKNRCTGCNRNLASDNPASQYQRQKIIQKTVRVPSSLYTMNIAALNAFESDKTWNTMSDRKNRSIQVAITAPGSTYHVSSTKHTITRLRPGALSPGGEGVDIKHNSYERYLNRLKGRAPLKQGPIPPDFGVSNISFNSAFPIYGGKVFKTGIVSGCNCGDVSPDVLYRNSAQFEQIQNITYTFNVGDFVWAKKTADASVYNKATIIAIDLATQIYTLQFEDGSQEFAFKCDLLIYFSCGDCTFQESDVLRQNVSAENCEILRDLEILGSL